MNTKNKRGLTPDRLEIMQKFSLKVKLEYIKKFCRLYDVNYQDVINLIPYTFLGKPRVHFIPQRLHPENKLKVKYLYYPEVKVGRGNQVHKVQLDWGIHSQSAGDASVPSSKYGMLETTAHSVSALIVRIFPNIKKELANNANEPEITEIPTNDYFIKDVDLLI